MKTFHPNRIALVTLAIGMLAGCSTMQVASDFEPSADFAHLKSFDFATGNQIQPADPKVNPAEAQQLVRGVIADALSTKGYQLQTNAVPDFLVGYGVVGTDKVQESETAPFTMGSTQWEDLPHTPHVREYREGTLVLTVGDPATKKIIWRASTVTEVSRSITPAEREQKLREAVAKLLANFPPK